MLFTQNFISQLRDTKEQKTQTNFLDFLVRNVSKNFPDILEFYEEIECVDSASRMDVQHIRKNLSDLESNIGIIESEIVEIGKVSTSKKDRYFNTKLTRGINL